MATNESINNRQQVINAVRDNPGITCRQATDKLKLPSGTVSSQLTQLWQQKVFQRVEGANGYGYTLSGTGEPVKPNGTKPHRKHRTRRHESSTATVLMMVQWGKNKSDLMTVDEARAIWLDLGKLFRE